MNSKATLAVILYAIFLALVGFLAFGKHSFYIDEYTGGFTDPNRFLETIALKQYVYPNYIPNFGGVIMYALAGAVITAAIVLANRKTQ